LVRRSSLLSVAVLAMLLATLGLFVRSLAFETWHLLLANFIALAGMGMGNVILPPLIKSYFPLRIGLLSAAYISLIQIGTMLPALLAVPLTSRYGWAQALSFWAFPALVAWCFALVLRIKNLQPDFIVGAQTPAAAVVMWRSPMAWGLVLMFGMTSLISYAMFTWLPLLLVEAGASAEFGGAMVALFAALGLVSSLLIPWAATRLRNPYPLVLLCLAAYAVAFPALMFSPLSYPILWVVLLGLGPSTFPLGLTLINLRTCSAAVSASLSGFAQGIGYLLSCLGPLLLGVLRDFGQGWVLPLSFLSFCALIMAVGAWPICQPSFVEDRPS
jgi:CP family cyanate transporter-like MFS transporter